MRVLFQADDGRYGFKEEDGQVVIPPIYDGAREFSEGLAQVEMVQDGVRRIAFIDPDGRVVVPFYYNYAMSFRGGLAAVCLGEHWVRGKFGCIDHEGREVIPVRYDYLEPLTDDLFIVRLSGKWYLMDACQQPRSPEFETQNELKNFIL